MKKHSYKKLEIYQRSLVLAVEIMKVVDEIRPFKLSDQIARACTSIPSNIAEGAERGSDLEFARFLTYSTGSAAELSTQLTIYLLSEKDGKHPVKEWIEETERVYTMIHAFIHHLRNSNT